MKIDILTLFPSMFDGFLHESIMKRALERNQVDIQIHNILHQIRHDLHKSQHGSLFFL